MNVAFTRKYLVLLGLPLGEDKLWSRRTWRGVSDRLLPIVHGARGPGAIRSSQRDGKRKVAFGRLRMDERSSEKWVHGSPGILAEKVTFVSAEVWAPHWNVCLRERLPPDVFVGLTQPF